VLNRIRNAYWAFRQSPNITLDQLDRLIELGDLGEKSQAGVRVSESTGARQATVYSCINIISRDIAALPLKLYERQADGGRAEVNSHPVAVWMKDPNSALTAVQYRQRSWAATLTCGNEYSQIAYSSSGQFETWPLSPARIVKVWLGPDNRKRYNYRGNDGSVKVLTSDEVFHNYGLSFDGYTGVSPIKWCMETIGHMIAIEQYAAAYFKSPVPKVILKHPTGFKTEADRDEYVKEWGDRFSGKKGLATVAILPNGMEVAQIVKVPNEEAQFIETAKLGKEAIAQIYQMPMHKLQALDRATFSNIEEQQLEYVMHTLKPWLTAYEQAVEKQFLSPEERNRYFVRHNLDELLRGDFKSRMEGHSIAVQIGVETVNEARALENRPAIDGGDDSLVPLNLGKLTDLGSQPAPAPPPPAP
jgi:HK97 family phage portal protein